MLLGWWNIDDVDWWKKSGRLNVFPEKEDYNKAQLSNMTGILADFNVQYLSFTNLAIFTIARVINDILGVNVFDIESIFQDKSTDGVSLSSEIACGLSNPDENLYKYIGNFITPEASSKLYDVELIRNYIIDIINSNMSTIYNTGIAYNTVNLLNLSEYYPHITLMDTCSMDEHTTIIVLKKAYGITKEQFADRVNTFTTNYYSVISTVLGEAINYINQKVSEIKNQQELNSIMPSGPIDLVTRINPEAAVQQPVQQAVPVQPVQQVNPAALSPEEEKAVQMMVNGMFFENMMQNAQQGVPVPQM